MALDRYTQERLAHCHISDAQKLAEELRIIERIEEERRQGEQLRRTPWVLHLLRSLAVGHIPTTLTTLQRLSSGCRKENGRPSPNVEAPY
ncbi:MAG TPA: hypothetical protein VHM88_19005 [Candidatus Acidoferrales bacterium]|jgi:hypothetical protein|nr:hypothetical protein [Candidatus Acidoferrales bacterium]